MCRECESVQGKEMRGVKRNASKCDAAVVWRKAEEEQYSAMGFEREN